MYKRQGPSNDGHLDPGLQTLVTDLDRVVDAVSYTGSLVSQRPPDLANLTSRVGQQTTAVDNTLDFENVTFDDIPVRPEESSLRKLTNSELLPPPV